MDCLITTFVVAVRIGCLVIGVVLVRRVDHLMFSFRTVYAALRAVLLPTIVSTDMVLHIP